MPTQTVRASILTFFSLILFFGCSDSQKQITSLADAANARIGVMTGTTGEQLAKQKYPNAAVKSFDDVMDAVAALKSGQLDAVITSYPTALNVSKRNHELVCLPEAVEYENTSIAVRKGNEKLVSQLNKIIAGMKNDGTLDDLKRRWFKTDLSPYDTVEIQCPDKGEALVIGVTATREPFCFVDANKQVTGHDGELARRVAVKLGKPIEFKDMKFSALITALQSGKIDLIITGMTATDERKKSVDFSDSYFLNSQVMLVKTLTASSLPGDSAGKSSGGTNSVLLKKLDDIAERRIGVLAGTIFDAFIMTKYPKAEIKRYNNNADMILALKTEKLDAALFDMYAAKVMMKKNPEIGVLSDKVLDTPLGFGFNKNNPQLKEKFNAYLKLVQSNGKFDSLYNKWFREDPENGRIPEFPAYPNAPQITLGVAVGDLPYSAYINGQYVGLDIELLKTFAHHERLDLKIISMDFSALIAALASGKVDIIADGISITEERAKQIDFSNKYMDFNTVVLALKSSMGQEEQKEKNTSELSFIGSVVNSFRNNIIAENRYLLIIDGLRTTAVISLLSIAFGSILGGLICYMRMAKTALLRLPAMFFISLLRGMPVLVVLMIIFYVVFASVDIDPSIVAVIAFGLNFAAYVSEMFRTGIEGVDKGQTEAGIAMGFSKVSTFIHIVLPQAARRVLPVYKGEVISLVKMTSIVGYIAVQDLTKASDIIRSRTFDAFFPLIMVAVLYFMISWLLMAALGYAERKFDPRTSTQRGI